MLHQNTGSTTHKRGSDIDDNQSQDGDNQSNINQEEIGVQNSTKEYSGGKEREKITRGSISLCQHRFSRAYWLNFQTGKGARSERTGLKASYDYNMDGKDKNE